MKKTSPAVAVASLFFLAAVPIRAQGEPKATVWIDPASQGASELQAAVMKKHTPITFTTDKDSATQIGALTVTEKKGSTAKAIFINPAASGAERNMTLVVTDPKTNTVVFSYTCQKRGEGANFQSAAECLAKHWSSFLEKGKP